MKYCSNCGSEVKEGADVCLSCGKQLSVNNVQNTATSDDGTLYGILGFCIPIVGLVLYLTMQESKPNSAKAAGVGALIGFGLGLLGILLVGV
jgi:hypothetical protein